MAEEVATPDVPGSSPETVDTISATPETTPTVSEDVTNTEDKNQGIPLSRFQEVNNALKDTRAELQDIKKALEAQAPPSDPAEKLDPEAERLLRAGGFVTKAEIEAEQSQLRGEMQLQTDLQELKGKYDDFDSEKVLPFAAQNMGAKSKEALEAAYIYLNQDKILEAERNKAIAEAKGVGVAEKATAGQAKQPDGPKLEGSSKDMITAALAHHRSGGQ